jgi:regulator of sirC expression with transglutaminase-like and TPR domain
MQTRLGTGIRVAKVDNTLGSDLLRGATIDPCHTLPAAIRHSDAAEIIGAVNDVLFRDLQFRGNTADYTDARNSFLNDVIERRIGIPITLSVVYMAVARRIGLALHGANFPGHFLIVRPRPQWPVVLDAFERGRILAPEDCAQLVARLGVAWDGGAPQPASDIAILRRMLENLKNIYTAARDWGRLLRTSEQIMVLTPDDIEQHRVQGVALAGMGEMSAAIRAFERYLEAQPDVEDADAIRDLIARLRQESN